MARRIELREASNLVFESSSEDDTCSKSSYSPDSEDCSETSSSGSEDISSQSDDDAPNPNSAPNSNAASNSIIWHQPTASFMPKFPTHDYIPCKPAVELPSTLQKIDSFKVFFPKSLCIFISQCTNERIHLHNIQKNTMIPHTDEGEVMIVLGVMFVMCYNRVPNPSDYWPNPNNPSLGNQFIKNAISRNRFEFLMSKLYCN